MARRSQEQADSAELMLDTICNVFGGIVLMSILVVINTQAAVEGLADNREAAQRAGLEARRIEIEISGVKDALDVLEEERPPLEQRYAADVPPEIVALLNRLGEFHTSIDEALRRLEQLRRRQSELAEDIEDADDDLKDAEGDLAAANGEKAAAEAAANAARAVRMRDVRLPMSHEPEAEKQLVYVVDRGRAYPEDHYTVVEPEISIVNGELKITEGKLIPVAGAGIAVSPEGQNTEFLATLKGTTSRSHYVTFFVRATDEAFVAVQVMRQLLGDRGYEFGYVIYGADDPITFGYGRPDAE